MVFISLILLGIWFYFIEIPTREKILYGVGFCVLIYFFPTIGMVFLLLSLFSAIFTGH